MACTFIRQPNGRLARWSSISDDFTHYDLTDAEALDVAIEEVMKIARSSAERAIQRAGGADDLEDAFDSIRYAHGVRRLKAARKELGAFPLPSAPLTPPSGPPEE